MNNQKKEITSGAFTIRFILAYIIISLISWEILNLLLNQILKITSLQSNTDTTSVIIYSAIIAIFLIANQWITAFFTTKLSLLKATVKKDDAYKAKRNMKIFLGIIIFLSSIVLLGIIVIVLLPVIQKLINNPTDSIKDLLIPAGISTLGYIISLVVLAKTCRKTFDKIVFGDGTNKTVQEQTNQTNEQVPVQNQVNQPQPQPIPEQPVPVITEPTTQANVEGIQSQNTMNQEIPQPQPVPEQPVQNNTEAPVQTNNNQ